MFWELFNDLERLDFLIRKKSTGTPTELARRLEMSERNLYYILGTMKMRGAPIAYCKKRKSYYYHQEGQFLIGFVKSNDPDG